LKGISRFAVAMAQVIATALPACGPQDNAPTHPDAGGGTGGSGGTSTADAGPVTVDSGAGASTSVGCNTDDDCTPEQECTGKTCTPKAVCPATLAATFDSLNTNIFSVSCGTSGSACHSHDGSVNSGGLNLTDDPYTALLGDDGKGAPAGNISGSEKNLVRVVPGDPDSSFLVIKLSTHTGMDKKYGSGMPFTDPGSVCSDTLATIRDWISAGAKH
jgi:hypothetical protein